MRWPLALALVLVALTAAAEPQANAALVFGGAAAGPEARFWDHGEVHLGVRGDCIFLRDDPWDFGLGPYGEIGTWAFNQLQTGGGLTAHLPVDADLPLLVSVGGHARFAADDLGPVAPGVSGTLFWGYRGYNAHEPYAVAAGLMIDMRHSFGVDATSGETMLTVALQVDATYIAMPFILLGGLLAGPTEPARPIE